MSEPRYPDIEVTLLGQDSNAFMMVGKVRTALRRGGASESEQELFFNEALSGDFTHVLGTIDKWVTIK